jgi:predicted transcriptional regulator
VSKEPKARPTKDEQVMTRMTTETKEELERIAVEMDRSVSWILNDLAVKFIAERGTRKA